MAKLAAKRPDLAIKKVNINRPEVKGIDWHSPLAQQYQIRQVPYFMIFSPQGKLVAQGRDAVGTVQGWLKEAGLMECYRVIPALANGASKPGNALRARVYDKILRAEKSVQTAGEGGRSWVPPGSQPLGL